jgi:hypothetical protein
MKNNYYNDNKKQNNDYNERRPCRNIGCLFRCNCW